MKCVNREGSGWVTATARHKSFWGVNRPTTALMDPWPDLTTQTIQKQKDGRVSIDASALLG